MIPQLVLLERFPDICDKFVYLSGGQTHTEAAWLTVYVFQPYLGVALINWVCDGLHKVVPQASLWVSVSKVWVSIIAGLVTADRLDQAQQGTAHQD